MDDDQIAEEKKRQLALIIQSLRENGAALASTTDGKVIFLSVDMLQQLLSKAENNGVEYVTILIKPQHTLN